MRQNSFKLDVNSVHFVEYQLPPEVVAAIADSSVALFVAALYRQQQIDFEEFFYTNLDGSGKH